MSLCGVMACDIVEALLSRVSALYQRVLLPSSLTCVMIVLKASAFSHLFYDPQAVFADCSSGVCCCDLLRQLLERCRGRGDAVQALMSRKLALHLCNRMNVVLEALKSLALPYAVTQVWLRSLYRR